MFTQANIDKSKCAKYREPIVLDEYIIHHNRGSRTFKVCDTIVGTMEANKMPYCSVKRHLKALNYESYYNEDNLMRLRLKIKETR